MTLSESFTTCLPKPSSSLSNANYHRAHQVIDIFKNTSICDDTLYEQAQKSVSMVRKNERLTFSAFFPTNYCDSGCSMCGMRATNHRLLRRFSDRQQIQEQLQVLRFDEGTQGVAIVTGEYGSEFSRSANAFIVGWTVEEALQRGFTHVVCNMGSLTDQDMAILTAGWPECAPVTLSVFQETYHLPSYEKYMGKTFAKSDFDRRRSTLLRWVEHGFKRVNPGILLGLGPVEHDLFELLKHVEELQTAGAEVWLSFPRLRPAHGLSQSGCADTLYVRALCAVATVFPECPIVLTTRESPEMQAHMLPVVGIMSPGSADVAPYTKQNIFTSDILPNRIESSQFVAQDARRPSAVLRSLSSLGFHFSNWSDPLIKSAPK